MYLYMYMYTYIYIYVYRLLECIHVRVLLAVQQPTCQTFTNKAVIAQLHINYGFRLK